eukprot:4962873-Pyramimonas_sp.AAC.1
MVIPESSLGEPEAPSHEAAALACDMGAMSDLHDDNDDDDILITGIRDESGRLMSPPTLRG